MLLNLFQKGDSVICNAWMILKNAMLKEKADTEKYPCRITYGHQMGLFIIKI